VAVPIALPPLLTSLGSRGSPTAASAAATACTTPSALRTTSLASALGPSSPAAQQPEQLRA
jgi:hypothetical protein